MASNLIQEYVDEFCQEKNTLDNILYVEETDSLCQYEEMEGYYKILDKRSLQKMMRSYLTKKGYNKAISMNTLNDFISQVKITVPKYIEHFGSDYVALNDQLLNVKTGEFAPFDRVHNVYHKINIDSASLAQETPMWLKFLSEIIVDRELNTHQPTIDVLQEAFGYALLDEISAQKLFFLFGTGSNGKSIVLEILINTIGRDFLSTSSIQRITGKFGAPALVGKKLNVCDEDESKYIAADNFKAIVTGNMITAEAKFGSEFNFVPRATLFFSSNKIPTFSSYDYGLKRRFMLIPFYMRIPDEKQDKNLTKKLLTELGGIISWAVEGAKRLVKNNYRFTFSTLIEELGEKFEEEISNAINFFRDKYEESEDVETKVSEMYELYSTVWCHENGRKPMNKDNFYRDIESILKLSQNSTYTFRAKLKKEST